MPSAVRKLLDVAESHSNTMPSPTKKRRGGAFDMGTDLSPKKKAAAKKASAKASTPPAAHDVDDPVSEQSEDHSASHRRPETSPEADNAKTSPPPAFDAAAFSSIAFGLSELNQRFSGDSPDGTIVGRDGEKKAIKSFFDATVGAKKAGSIYICGKPGTGKTAMVKGICNDLKRKCRCVSVNGMTLTGGAKDLFVELLKAVCPGAIKEKIDPEEALRKIFTAPSVKGGRDTLTLVVIDEMDALLEQGQFQATLCALFEWPKLKNSRVVVVGIANALDLAERFLPMLIRKGCAPAVVSFSAYTDAHMLDILRARLLATPPAGAESLPPSPSGVKLSCDAAALELCARRVSAESGDMRKALEACRLAAQAASQQAYAGGAQVGSVCAVKISHMVKVLNHLFAPKNTRALRELPLHQALVLCGAIVAARAGEQGLTEEALIGRYLTICRKNGLPPLQQGEVRQLGASLVDSGIMKRSKEPRSKVAWLRLDMAQDVVSAVLEETPLFKHAMMDFMRTSALAQI